MELALALALAHKITTLFAKPLPSQHIVISFGRKNGYSWKLQKPESFHADARETGRQVR
ncbi:MAG: hypothetical protein H7234_02980 [Herminiimonas sp.]|nr:hypothetical protein [Herminiimonas sp.]